MTYFKTFITIEGRNVLDKLKIAIIGIYKTLTSNEKGIKSMIWAPSWHHNFCNPYSLTFIFDATLLWTFNKAITNFSKCIDYPLIIQNLPSRSIIWNKNNDNLFSNIAIVITKNHVLPLMWIADIVLNFRCLNFF